MKHKELDIPRANFCNMSIQLGLCCINTSLKSQKPSVFCSRKPILKTVNGSGGLEILTKKCTENCADLITMIEQNYKDNIHVFRMSSELFPHKANPKAISYNLDFAQSLLEEAGQLAKKYNQRLTFHPGQYNVIGAKDPEKYEKTVKELDYHAEVLDRMGLDHNSVMVVHGGGTYGNKKETIERWTSNFEKMPERVRRRLVLENCEKSFSVVDCLDISRKTGVPVVFDNHHHNCYKKLHPNEQLNDAGDYISEVLKTWKTIKPKFHLSEQGSGRLGHHSDRISAIPDYYLEIPKKYGINIDIMIEAKDKEQAIFQLYHEYPDIFLF